MCRRSTASLTFPLRSSAYGRDVHSNELGNICDFPTHTSSLSGRLICFCDFPTHTSSLSGRLICFCDFPAHTSCLSGRLICFCDFPAHTSSLSGRLICFCEGEDSDGTQQNREYVRMLCGVGVHIPLQHWLHSSSFALKRLVGFCTLEDLFLLWIFRLFLLLV